jgi:hypothetical protein
VHARGLQARCKKSCQFSGVAGLVIGWDVVNAQEPPASAQRELATASVKSGAKPDDCNDAMSATVHAGLSGVW